MQKKIKRNTQKIKIAENLHHHATTTSHRSQGRFEPGRRRSAELEVTWGSGVIDWSIDFSPINTYPCTPPGVATIKKKRSNKLFIEFAEYWTSSGWCRQHWIQRTLNKVINKVAWWRWFKSWQRWWTSSQARPGWNKPHCPQVSWPHIKQSFI